MNKINFKQPKYIFPAILYVLLLITGWLFIDMFTTEIKTVDPRLMATEYLNSELPEARVDERLGSKRENMVNAFGDVKDYTAIANAERDSAKGKEEYETRYNAKEAATVQHNNELEQLRQLQKRAQSASAPKMGSDDFVVPLTDEERQNARRLRGRESRSEADDLISQARSFGKGYGHNTLDNEDNSTAEAVAQNGKKTGVVNSDTNESEEAETVVKKTKGESEYFNTVSQNDPGFNLITAIIDENIKAVDGSRVRLRLLDDVEIGGMSVPKGTYLYATMSGFSKQRVKGKVGSVFVGDQIKTINLTIYDTDGLEGLYVPSSSFRETAKEIGSSAMQQSMSVDGSSSSTNVAQWAGQAVQQAYQRTSQAISKAIRKNKVTLKYGTRVYLINGQQLKNNKK
jgi:conjugative transposon TraM protein